jgi:hypothetical protein
MNGVTDIVLSDNLPVPGVPPKHRSYQLPSGEIMRNEIQMQCCGLPGKNRRRLQAAFQASTGCDQLREVYRGSAVIADYFLQVEHSARQFGA